MMASSVIVFKANAVQYRLLVRDYKTLQITNLFTNLDAVQGLEVSNFYLRGFLNFNYIDIHVKLYVQGSMVAGFYLSHKHRL